MTAYWVARSKVNNPENYKRYTDLVPDILKKYGGRALSRGGNYQIMEGPEYFNRFIQLVKSNQGQPIMYGTWMLPSISSKQYKGSDPIQNALKPISTKTSRNSNLY